MIVSGGENIASSELEHVIYGLPQVNEVAVVGVPDPLWGERPVVAVVLKGGGALDLAALQAHCRAHLTGFEVPRGLVLREAFPRSPSGKVLKRVLRDEQVAAASGGQAVRGGAPVVGPIERCSALVARRQASRQRWRRLGRVGRRGRRSAWRPGSCG